jgi:hypothetical protein
LNFESYGGQFLDEAGFIDGTDLVEDDLALLVLELARDARQPLADLCRAIALPGP